LFYFIGLHDQTSFFPFLPHAGYAVVSTSSLQSFAFFYKYDADTDAWTYAQNFTRSYQKVKSMESFQEYFFLLDTRMSHPFHQVDSSFLCASFLLHTARAY
jgi:hypothetical protein